MSDDVVVDNIDGLESDRARKVTVDVTAKPSPINAKHQENIVVIETEAYPSPIRDLIVTTNSDKIKEVGAIAKPSLFENRKLLSRELDVERSVS